MILSNVPPNTLPPVVLTTSHGTTQTISLPLPVPQVAGTLGPTLTPPATQNGPVIVPAPRRSAPTEVDPSEYFVSNGTVSTPSSWAPSDEAPDPKTADVLPTQPNVTVSNTLVSNQPGPVYCIELDPGMERLIIDIRVNKSSTTIQPGVMIFDQDHHKLMEALADPTIHGFHIVFVTANFSVHGRLPHLLYLKFFMPPNMAAGNSGTGTNATLDASTITTTGPTSSAFQMNVQRQTLIAATLAFSATPTVLGQGLTALPSFVGTAFGGLRETGLASLAASVTTSPLPVVTDLTELTVPGRIATGPLPTRASAPFGGVLGGDDDPAPVVSREQTAAVDLALTALSPAKNHESGRANTLDAAPLVTNEGDGAVVSLRGPGGFPLLGTALIANLPSARVGLADRLPTISFARSTTMPADDLTPVTPSEETAPESPTTRRTSRTMRRVTALTGISLALALVSSAILPDVHDPSRAEPAPRSRLRNFLPRSRKG